MSRALHTAPPVPEGPGSRLDITPPSLLSVLISSHRLKCVFAHSHHGNACNSCRHLHCHIHRHVATLVCRFSRVQTAPPVCRCSRIYTASLAPSDFHYHFCEARLFQVSPCHCLLICQCVGSVAFFAKPSGDAAQLCGFLCAPSYSSRAGAGKLTPGSIGYPESITAVHFSIPIVLVDLLPNFLFRRDFSLVVSVTCVGFSTLLQT